MAIPPYYPFGAGTLFTAEPCNTNFTTPGVSVSGYKYLSFLFTYTGFTSTDATFVLEVSNDNVNWDPKTGANFTAAVAADTQGISLNGVVTEAWYRVVFTKNTNNGGTCTCVMVGKT